MPFSTITPVGRIVQGNPLVGNQVKDDHGALVFNQDGTPKLNYYMGLAISKQDPAAQQLIAKIDAEARAAWPNLFDPATGECRDKKFSIKYFDGDGFDHNGKAFAEREGMAGHWIIRLQSNYPLRSYDGMAGNVEITDPERIYRGCYAVAAIEVKTNGATGTNTRGLYINSQGVQMVGHGERILGGANPDELFGAAGAAIPQGAYVPAGMSTTPVAPPAPAAMQAVPTPPPAPHPTFRQQVLARMVQEPAPAVPTPPPPAVPHPTFVQQAVAPQFVLTPAGQAQGFTIEQWYAAGYTEAQLLQNGTIAHA